MRKWRKISWLLLLVFLTVSGVVWAQSAAIVTVQKDQVIPGAKFAAGQIIKLEGTIKGDLFFWGQNISSTGTIEGDAIGIGQEVNLSGNVLGDVRTGGGTVNLGSAIGKNVNVFGGVVTFSENAVIGGNVFALGGQVTINGRVKGQTMIKGGNIVLNGEFFGDVAINNFKTPASEYEDDKAKLTVLPGTVIHGKLKFQGGSAQIQKGAQVAAFQWIKSEMPLKEKQQREVRRYLRKFIRLLFTTAAYFLIGLLFISLFGAISAKMEQFTLSKPWRAVGYGLIALSSIVAAALVWVILLAFSFFMSPAFGLVFGVAAAAGYIVLFYLATIPAALWLGGLILKEKRDTAYRFGIGLIIFNFGLFALDLLGKLPVAGPVFPGLSFIARFGAVILGTGALLYAIHQIYLAAKNKSN